MSWADATPIPDGSAELIGHLTRKRELHLHRHQTGKKPEFSWRLCVKSSPKCGSINCVRLPLKDRAWGGQ